MVIWTKIWSNIRAVSIMVEWKACEACPTTFKGQYLELSFQMHFHFDLFDALWIKNVEILTPLFREPLQLETTQTLSSGNLKWSLTSMLIILCMLKIPYVSSNPLSFFRFYFPWEFNSFTLFSCHVLCPFLALWSLLFVIVSERERVHLCLNSELQLWISIFFF